MRVSLIAAMAANRVIGRDNGLPWYLPPDLKRFKALTMGHVLVMGRRTYDSVGQPLPGRTNLVVTRQEGWTAPGVVVARSLPAAIEEARRRGESELFIAGGAEVYRQALPLADRIYLTRIEADFAGDARFPEIPAAEWRLAESEGHPLAGTPPVPFRFEVWERIAPAAPDRE
jgi:dihydrofolate reductase